MSMLDPIDRLHKDLKEASKVLSRDEARFLVDSYYKMQDDRKRANSQLTELEKSGEPHAVILWLAQQSRSLENSVKRALDAFSGQQLLGQWARAHIGIAEVISAGLLAHIDITKAPTPGHIWRFAGLDPTVIWKKGEKRPFNASLKTLCWKLGDSFVKQSGKEENMYGRFYKERKVMEETRNEALAFKDQADVSLASNRRFTDNQKSYYKAGKLPPARIHLRAQRYAVKIFLAHYHDVGYFLAYNKLPPRPYAITHLGHAHHIHPTHMDMIPGMLEAKKKQGPITR